MASWTCCSCKKYDVTQKEKDLVQPYLEEGKTFYDIPWEIVREYGIADVISTEEIALKQLDAFGTTFEELFNDENLLPHTTPVLEMTDALARIERNGLRDKSRHT